MLLLGHNMHVCVCVYQKKEKDIDWQMLVKKKENENEKKKKLFPATRTIPFKTPSSSKGTYLLTRVSVNLVGKR